MKRIAITLSLVLCTTALQGADLDGVWLVHDGRQDPTTLSLTIDSDGSVHATLADIQLAGALTGDQLTLHATTPNGPEVWMGWPAVEGGDPIHLAGVVHRPDGTARGWYAVRPDRAKAAAGTRPASVPLPATVTAAEPRPETEQEPEPAPATQPTPQVAPAPQPTPRQATTTVGTGFEGLWQGAFATYTIARDGSSLTVTGSDGTTANGRVTGPQTLVVGLRKGCCKGAVTKPGMIVWQDDTVWRRVEE